MTWRVSVRPAAAADLRQARDWYEHQRPGLGDEFLLSIAEAMASLKETLSDTPSIIGASAGC